MPIPFLSSKREPQNICLCKGQSFDILLVQQKSGQFFQIFWLMGGNKKRFFTDVEVPILVCSSPCLRTGTLPHVMIYWSFPSVVSWRVTSILESFLLTLKVIFLFLGRLLHYFHKGRLMHHNYLGSNPTEFQLGNLPFKIN
jgi:hypothetical protein